MALDRTVSVKLKADVAGYMASLKQAGAQTASFAKGIEQGAVKNRAHLDKLGTGLLTVGAVAGLGVAAAVKSFADFDKAMSSVEAATHESAAGMELLRDAAIDAGARTAFSANEAAGAQEALAKAGVSTADILGGALNGALDLAAAGTLGVSDAAEIAATAMTQFGLAGSDVPHIADLLAAAAGKAQGEVSDMGVALKYVGPIAHQMGVSLEETTGTIALLATNGILADQAGTSLRGMLSSLTAPSEAAAAAMEKYKISVYDAAGQFIGFDGVAGQLHDRLGTLDSATRDAAFGQIFGNAQITAARILYEGGAGAVEDWTNKVNDAGFAQETAAIKMDNLAGDIEKLKGSLQSLLIETGQGADGFLRGAVQGLEKFVNALGDLPQPAKDAALLVGAVVTAIGLIGGGGIKAITTIASMKSSLATLGTTAQSAGIKVGIAGLAFAAVGGAIALWANEHAKAKQKVDDLTDAILADNNAIGAQSRALIVSEMSKGGILKAAEELQIPIETLTSAFMGNATAIKEVQRLTPGTAAGFSNMGREVGKFNPLASEASRASNTITLAMADQTGALGEAVKAAQLETEALSAMNGPMDEAGKATSSWKDETVHAIEPMKWLREEQELAATAASEQADALVELVDALELLNDENISAAEAQIDFNDGIRDMRKAVKEGSKSLKENTEEGDANIGMILNMIKTADEHAKAVGKNGGDTQQVWEKDIATIRRVARELGLNEGAVRKLIKANSAVQPKVATVFTVPGLDSSITNTKAYQDHLRSLPKSKLTQITARGAAAAAAAVADYKRWLDNLPREVQTRIRTIRIEERNTRFKNAAGGYISGPGGPTSDSIPAWLSNGEFVINAAATAANRGLLEAINKGGLASGAGTMRTPSSGYANGGPVSAGATFELNYGDVVTADPNEFFRRQEWDLNKAMVSANLIGAG